MRRLRLPFGITLAFLCGISTSLATRSNPATTEWLSNPSEAARIARVETRMPAVAIEREDSIGLTLERWMALYKVPGLSVAVFDGHRLIWAKGYGVKETGKPEPVTLDTLFQAGSISKPVTAMAVLHHAEAGAWSLDQDINERLVSWKVPDSPHMTSQRVTLRRLLSHSAGTTVHGFPGYAVGEPIPTLVQVLDGERPANTAPVRVDIVPGTRTRYSGGGTTIVQLMMVDRLKKPFPQIMAETVFCPIGMSDSSYEQPLPDRLPRRTASGTRANGATVEGRWHIYPEMAAAGLWTTATDLARLAIEVAKSKAGTSNRVLSPAMTRQMLTLQSESFGLGFALDGGADRFGHGGADEGFQAYLTAFADSGRGVAIMANSDNGFMIFERLASSIAQEYGWSALDAGAPPLFVKVGLLARLRGADRAVAWYRAMTREAGSAEFGPPILNCTGYMLLREGSVADAVKLFEANVSIYPEDANAYDSLAEGYLKAGNKDGAITNYKKALRLDPKNANAVKMLEKLGVRWTPDQER